MRYRRRFKERVEKGKAERSKDEKGFKKQGRLRKDARKMARKSPRKDGKGQRRNCLPFDLALLQNCWSTLSISLADPPGKLQGPLS